VLAIALLPPEVEPAAGEAGKEEPPPAPEGRQIAVQAEPAGRRARPAVRAEGKPGA